MDRLDGPIPAPERFEKNLPAERDALDLPCLGQFHLAARRTAEARAAFRDVAEKFPRAKSAPAARELLKGPK